MAHEGLVDKRAYLNTIGCLIQDSSLIDDIDRPLDRTDFNTENFYELLFVAIYNLHMQGCTTIDEFSIISKQLQRAVFNFSGESRYRISFKCKRYGYH